MPGEAGNQTLHFGLQCRAEQQQTLTHLLWPCQRQLLFGFEVHRELLLSEPFQPLALAACASACASACACAAAILALVDVDDFLKDHADDLTVSFPEDFEDLEE